MGESYTIVSAFCIGTYNGIALTHRYNLEAKQVDVRKNSRWRLLGEKKTEILDQTAGNPCLYFSFISILRYF